jgi:hypothetical protein
MNVMLRILSSIVLSECHKGKGDVLKFDYNNQIKSL